MEQKIDFDRMLAAAEQLASQSIKLDEYCGNLQSVKNSLFISGQTQYLLKEKINHILNNIESEGRILNNMHQTLTQIAAAYRNSEQKITDVYGTRRQTMIPGKESKVNLSDNVLDGWKQNLKGSNPTENMWDWVTNGLEGGIGIAGTVNTLTAAAKGPEGSQSFILLSGKTSGKTLWAAKASSLMNSTAGKVGIPIAGGIIDFGIMMGKGEEVGDAAIKAGAHTVIGVAGGAAGGAIGKAAGAAIGAFLGSVFPGAGTVIGGAIGSVVGLGLGIAVSFAGNALFDAFYDKQDEEK